MLKFQKEKIKGLGNILFDKNFSNKKKIINRYKVFKEKEEDTWYWYFFLKNRNIDLALDIGCNVGVYSLLAAKIFKKINLLSFDASLKNCDVTLDLLENNFKSKSKNFIVQQAYLGSKTPSIVDIGIRSINSGETIGTDKERRIIKDKKYKLLKLSLNSFGNFTKIFKKKIKSVIMKIDLDGGELEFLHGISKDQWNKIKSMSVEVDLFDFSKTNKILKLIRRKNLKSSISNLKIIDYYYSCLFKNNTFYDKNISETVLLLKKIKTSLNNDFIYQKCKKLNFFSKRLIRKKAIVINKKVISSKRFAVNLFFYDK